MERQGYFESGTPDFLKKNKESKSARSVERAAVPRPEPETLPKEPAEVKQPTGERPYVPVTPLEGIISWRDRESTRLSSDTSNESDDDDSEDDDEDEAGAKTAASNNEADTTVPETTAEDDEEAAVPQATVRPGVLPVANPAEAAGSGGEVEPEPAEGGPDAAPEANKPLPEFANPELGELPPIMPREQEAGMTEQVGKSGVRPEQTVSTPTEDREPDAPATDWAAKAAGNGNYDNYFPRYGSELPYRGHRGGPSAEMPEPAGVRQENPAEYLPRPHTHGGILALLGLEHLARKNADRGVEKRLGEYFDAGLRVQEQRSDSGFERLERQQREAAAEQQRYYRTHEAQQRRYESLHGPAVSPETQRRPEMNPLPSDIGEEAPDQPRKIHVEPKQHIEHSTWHNIVVDKRGREVVGAIEYGRGFQAERRKEAIRSELFSSGSSAAAGQSAASYSDQLPSGLTTPTLPSGRALRSDPQHRISPPNNQVVPGVSNSWLWGTVLLVLAAIIAVVFL